MIENMSGFTTPDGQRFTIFGEGGGQLLADELDVPLLAKMPLQEELRVAAPTRAGRSCSTIRRAGGAGDLPRRPRRSSPRRLRSSPCSRSPPAPVPEVTGTALPMA